MSRYILFFLVSLSFLGCSQSQVIREQPQDVAPVIQEYVLGVGDALTISVWRSPEFSSEVVVRPDGKISVPLIGDTYVAGISAEKLSKKLESDLVTYIKNPQITVSVRSSASSAYLGRVRITGAVVRPMSVVHRQGMTVLDLVLEAGGLNDFAKGNGAKLYRKIDGKLKAYPVNISDMLNSGNIESNYLLAPSDILTVPERSF